MRSKEVGATRWLNSLLDALDHPVTFVFALGLALIGFYGILVFALSEWGYSGPALAIRNT